jgi:hypothetical protein
MLDHPKGDQLRARRGRIAVPAVIGGLMICLPGATAAERPEAHQSAQCGSVSAGNGESKYINAILVSCSKARKVAKKARGQKKYKSSKLTCRRKAKTISGVGYNCTRKGRDGGVGFIYVKP